MLTPSQEQTVVREEPQKNKRAHPRMNCVRVVDYSIDNKHFYRDFVLNSSRGGLFIESRNCIPVGQKLTLLLHLSCDSKPLKVRGEVVWSNHKGMGVRYYTRNSD